MVGRSASGFRRTGSRWPAGRSPAPACAARVRAYDPGMPNRAHDWFRQAEHDLQHARSARGAGDHDWACFAAQQAAEKAVKALHQARGQEAWGHSVLRLLEALPEPAPGPLIEKARGLDAFYVPARYPNGHFTGPAFEYYGPLQSDQALSHAGDVVEFVRQALADA